MKSRNRAYCRAVLLLAVTLLLFLASCGAGRANAGEPSPGPCNVEREFTFRLIVLDEPRTMILMSGSGDGSREGSVSMIDVSSADGIERYDGQRLIFSIDPSRTRWPSDVSLPLGESRTSDVLVLS